MAIGFKGVHFHDLRYSGNTWAAQAGTSTKDLMVRMGHDDMRAAITISTPAVRLTRPSLTGSRSGWTSTARGGDKMKDDGSVASRDDGAAGVLVPAS